MSAADFDLAYWESQRQIADPIADRAIEAAMEDPAHDVRRVLGHLMHNDSIPREKLPDALHEYLKISAQLPEWADMEKIKIAQNMFDKYGLQMLFMLLCRSLPETYSCWKGVRLLHETGRLAMHTTSLKPYTRRIMETLQFVMNVLTPDSFLPKGNGIETIQKIRLVHSSIRFFIKQQMPEWDSVTNGVPINQEDLVMTLNTFSVSVLDGMVAIGVPVSKKHREAFVHFWAVVGHVLGIAPQNLPRTSDEAAAVQKLILSHQSGYSDFGAELERALLNFIHFISPGKLIPVACEHATRQLLGPELCACIGLSDHESRFKKAAERTFTVTLKVAERVSLANVAFRFVAKYLTRRIIRDVIHHFNANKDMNFTIPASLRG